MPAVHTINAITAVTFLTVTVNSTSHSQSETNRINLFNFKAGSFSREPVRIVAGQRDSQIETLFLVDSDCELLYAAAFDGVDYGHDFAVRGFFVGGNDGLDIRFFYREVFGIGADGTFVRRLAV